MLWVLVALVRASGQRPDGCTVPHRAVPDGSMTELIAASRDGDKAAVESQLAAGADLNERDEVYIIYANYYMGRATEYEPAVTPRNAPFVQPSAGTDECVLYPVLPRRGAGTPSSTQPLTATGR